MEHDIQPEDSAYGTLCLKAVLAIEGDFYVPKYQRGYRWGAHEVRQLVTDVLDNLDRQYCLQPVVVKHSADGWELIDGQQRLTTLFLLVRALGRSPGWTLRYETRPESTDFLNQPDETRAAKNIDFHHMWQAKRAIDEELGALTDNQRAAMLTALDHGVRVIWYQAPAQVNAIDLFTRLNSGRIPLDDAELFKALMLSKTLAPQSGEAGEEENARDLMANQLAVQWDMIERDLRRPEIWAFLAGNRTCASHITLVLEIIAGVSPPDAEGTFKVFDALSKKAGNGDVAALWDEIVQLYERMIGWYEDLDTYHHIGFLIAQAGVGGRDEMLRDIAAKANENLRSEFANWLVGKIRDSVKIAKSGLTELHYDQHNADIKRLLLLMNVVATKKSDGGTSRYPFAAYHADSWELEHIHAQKAPELNKAEQWDKWVTEHEKAVLALPEDDRRNSTMDAIHAWRKTRDTKAAAREAFQDLAREILAFLAGNDADQSDDELHGISNLALLSKKENIGLGNSAFEVKRQMIITYERNGRFIPVCTRHVFLKFYADADAVHPHFWGAKDRTAYMTAIGAALEGYLAAEGER